MFGTTDPFGALKPFGTLESREEIADYGSYWLEQCKDAGPWTLPDKDVNVVRDCQRIKQEEGDQ